MEYVEKRLWNYAYLNPGLMLKCNGQEYISQHGIQDLLEHEMDGKALYNIFYINSPVIEFTVTRNGFSVNFPVRAYFRNFGKTCTNTFSVNVTQSTFYIMECIKFFVYLSVFNA